MVSTTLKCDGCGNTMTVEDYTTPGKLRQAARKAGWTRRKLKDLCATCWARDVGGYALPGVK